MDKDVMIRVEGVSKRYTLGRNQGAGGYTALRDVLSDRVRRLWRKGNLEAGLAADTTDFWALRDVTFEVRRGEVVGIIGRNGAGKSTLLKILSRITEPTNGTIRLRGRVASLLEVGTGFHPELTGRENIFLNGAILGMDRVEIKAKFDEIVAFAEVERFLDTPVKRYSSGMYVRLAFAVAAHLEPEILIVDEVLAVGDAAFQKKCLGKMQEVSSRGGRTVLFVSHQMAAVESLCSRGIVLRRGELSFDGNTKSAVGIYLKEIEAETAAIDVTRLERSGDGTIRLTKLTLRNSSGIATLSAASGAPLEVVLDYEQSSERAARNVSVGISIHDHRGEMLTVLYNDYTHRTFDILPSRGQFICTIPDFPFSIGRYYVGARVLVNGVEADWPRQMLGSIDVEAGDFYGNGSIGQHGLGPILLRGSWRFESSSGNPAPELIHRQ